MSLLIDVNGQRVSGATPDGLAAFEQGARELLCFVDDPLASVERALQLSPGMPMAHVLKAWLHLLGTEPSGNAVALTCCEAAAKLEADERERAHIDAARALALGRWREAGLRLEDLSACFPRDSLALQVGHQIDFFRGDSRMLRDRIARALPAWEPARPGWHALLGMYAFGLEETGDYAAAEAAGRRSIEIEPRDGWGWHALAHVYEMRNTPKDGVALLGPTRGIWSRGSFLATHNSWHLALFELELDRHDEVLRLYDEAIGGTGSQVVMDLLDASAMLWRLHLRGVALGGRFGAVADRWAAVGGFGKYAFNDLHAMLAFVGAGRPQDQRALAEVLDAAMRGDLDNAEFTREVGRAATLAMMAFGEGDFGRAVELLRRVRSGAHRFGGSHAQRDLIDLTLIEAAQRSGNKPLAGALTAERLAVKPRSPLAMRLAVRAGVVPRPH